MRWRWQAVGGVAASASVASAGGWKQWKQRVG